MVLDCPEIALHINGSENDIRCFVARRKGVTGTRSDAGRDSRDALLSLTKPFAKVRIPVWDYPGSRPACSHRLVRPLLQRANLIFLTAASAHTFATLAMILDRERSVKGWVWLLDTDRTMGVAPHVSISACAYRRARGVGQWVRQKTNNRAKPRLPASHLPDAISRVNLRRQPSHQRAPTPAERPRD